MRRFWDWLFPRNLVVPLAHVKPQTRAALVEFRPDLLPEFDVLCAYPVRALSAWLDFHFPRAGTRWGIQPVGTLHLQLRDYLEHAK